MHIRPAAANSGIVFRRTDVMDRPARIPALWHYVTDTRLCTMIMNEHEVSVGTIEHVMAALRGCGIDNALIDLDGPEVPIMDGSARPFVEAIEDAGILSQKSPRRLIQILRPVSVQDGDKRVTLRPADIASFEGEIAFDHQAIGRQSRSVALLNGNFAHDIAAARTFGFKHEVEALRAAGLARGGSLENAIVLDEHNVLNDKGLRFEDEFIRHKLLDAVGDLYLAGAPLLAKYEGHKAGHALNNAILHELFSRSANWRIVLEDGSLPQGRTVSETALEDCVAHAV